MLYASLVCRLHAGSNLIHGREQKVTVAGARTLWSWGSADHGRGGSGGHTDAPIFEVIQKEPEKVEKPVLPAKLIKKVACGGAHSMIVTESGRLLTCGLNDSGQLGQGNLENASEFEEVKGTESIADVAAGFWHTLAASKKGKLYAWGSNKHGQLGHHDAAVKLAVEPQEILLLRDAPIKQVACGSYHSMALTKDGEVYTWGFGAHGRLGHGSTEDEFMPKRVEALVGENISSIHAGFEYSSAVSTSGKVFVWGYGHFYVLGQGDKKDQLAPVVLDFPTSIRQLAFGSFHAAAVSHSGMLFTWGHATHGPLGHGQKSPNIILEPTFLDSPAQVSRSFFLPPPSFRSLALSLSPQT